MAAFLQAALAILSIDGLRTLLAALYIIATSSCALLENQKNPMKDSLVLPSGQF